ncbi:DNA excision repair protein ERCC-1 [Macrosteles quadrilineatus]|uniref:DNA excision repair protein ERCC-1 n=1 Tax=Macrosteles quadrilineatus TaxID=74068 RepID=UPI0023E1341A|nr:DNA excision repair protein ERCC-1 [Macrosteles quadrilineatus]
MSLASAFSKLKKTDIYESVVSEAAKVSSDSEAGPSTSTSSVPKPASSNSVLVSPKQRGNPLLKSISNVPWEFDESIIPDYVMGRTTCALFLSLRYHNLKPDYINERLKQLGKLYDLRVLLVQVDMKDPHTPLKHLTRVCLLADLTLMLAWSPEEAAKIIETYKIFEHKPPDMIMERQESDPHIKLVSALTCVRSINKTDATTLLTTFGSLGKIIKANQDTLGLCPGLGPQKATRLYKTLHLPFLKEGKTAARKVGIAKFLKS